MFDLLGRTPVPKIYQETASFDGDGFKVYWSYNSTADSLYFKLDVAATGWVGFGFSKEMRTDMMGYDVVVGGVTNGQMYLMVGIFHFIKYILYYSTILILHCSCGIYHHFDLLLKTTEFRLIETSLSGQDCLLYI